MKWVIRKSQAGWVIYDATNPDNFVPFLCNEPERFVKHLAEKIAGIKVDALVRLRQEEIDRARKQIEADQK